MKRIAHLSDVHLLEHGHRARAASGRARLSFLSFGRPLDAAARRERLRRSLSAARRAKVDHVVLTGDLTEDGAVAQFEALAEDLSTSGLAPETVTLVPGNHDAYDDPTGWDRALAGPLRPWAATSHAGAVTEIGEAVVVAISSACHQHPLFSSGSVASAQLDRLRDVASSPRFRNRPVIAAQHHPPGRRALAAVQWWDGLREHRELGDILARHANVHVLHGHAHERRDVAVPGEVRPRIFGASAVVDCDTPVRFYEVWDDAVAPVEHDA